MHCFLSPLLLSQGMVEVVTFGTIVLCIVLPHCLTVNPHSELSLVTEPSMRFTISYRGFPTRMVYLYYISCLRYTILVGNPRYDLLLNLMSIFVCVVFLQDGYSQQCVSWVLNSSLIARAFLYYFCCSCSVRPHRPKLTFRLGPSLICWLPSPVGILLGYTYVISHSTEQCFYPLNLLPSFVLRAAVAQPQYMSLCSLGTL